MWCESARYGAKMYHQGKMYGCAEAYGLFGYDRWGKDDCRKGLRSAKQC